MRTITILTFAILQLHNAFPQTASPEVIVSSGGYFTGSETSLSWTVGEVVTGTFFGNNLLLTQGFQPEVPENTNATSLYSEQQGNNFTVYPNPATGYLSVKYNGTKNSISLIRILSPDGRILLESDFNSGHRISLGTLNSGYYILSVLDDQERSVFTTKFVKY